MIKTAESYRPDCNRATPIFIILALECYDRKIANLSDDTTESKVELCYDNVHALGMLLYFYYAQTAIPEKERFSVSQRFIRCFLASKTNIGSTILCLSRCYEEDDHQRVANLINTAYRAK